MLVLKQNPKKVFFVLFILGVNLLASVNVTCGQSLKELFPNVYLQPYSLASPAGLQALQLDDVQFRELAPLLAKRLDENGQFLPPIPTEEVDRMIREKLTPEQLHLADRFIVTQFYSRIAVSVAPTNARFTKWDLIPVNDVMDFLELDQVRRAKITQIKTELSKSRETLESKRQEEVKKICEQWQRALTEVLLSQQTKRYENAMGKTFGFPQKFENSFGAFERENVRGRVIDHNPSGVYQAINNSPYRYIDAVKDPRSLVAVLLEDQVSQELKINPTQKISIKRLQKDILERMPFPEENRPVFDQGERDDYRDSKIMDNDTREDLSKEEERVMAILFPEQRTRINQIWNQLMVNLTWRHVPLGFSDWPSYLELSESQTAEFQKIHRHYRQMISHLGENLRLEYAKQASEYRSSLQELLTEPERMRFELVFLDDVSGFSATRFQALWQELYVDDK